MNEIANPLIGATGDRETIENAAEALAGALDLMVGKHAALRGRLALVLAVMEEHAASGMAADSGTIRGAHQVFTEVMAAIADRHSALCRLLQPVLHAMDQVSVCRS